METAYEETYLFVLWTLSHVPYPRNETIQIEVSSFGMQGGLPRLTDTERQAWERYKVQAKAALGERFIAAKY